MMHPLGSARLFCTTAWLYISIEIISRNSNRIEPFFNIQKKRGKPAAEHCFLIKLTLIGPVIYILYTYIFILFELTIKRSENQKTDRPDDSQRNKKKKKKEKKSRFVFLHDIPFFILSRSCHVTR